MSVVLPFLFSLFHFFYYKWSCCERFVYVWIYACISIAYICWKGESIATPALPQLILFMTYLFPSFFLQSTHIFKSEVCVFWAAYNCNLFFPFCRGCLQYWHRMYLLLWLDLPFCHLIICSLFVSHLLCSSLTILFLMNFFSVYHFYSYIDFYFITLIYFPNGCSR